MLKYIGNISILPKYRQRWLNRRNASKIISERKWATAKEKAEKLITDLSHKELAIIGACLYWAEGAKKDFSFSNTDPIMIRVFLEILRKYFKINNDDIKISLRIYSDLNPKVCLGYWSKITKINLSSRNTSVNILSGSKHGKLKYGMCRIRVRKPSLLIKEVFSIINRIDNLIPS